MDTFTLLVGNHQPSEKHAHQANRIVSHLCVMGQHAKSKNDTTCHSIILCQKSVDLFPQDGSFGHLWAVWNWVDCSHPYMKQLDLIEHDRFAAISDVGCTFPCWRCSTVVGVLPFTIRWVVERTPFVYLLFHPSINTLKHLVHQLRYKINFDPIKVRFSFKKPWTQPATARPSWK